MKNKEHIPRNKNYKGNIKSPSQDKTLEKKIAPRENNLKTNPLVKKHYIPL